MIGSILEHDDLLRIFRVQRMADLEKKLKAQGIRYGFGRGGLWTTTEALNSALGVAPASANDGAAYRPDDVFG